MTTLLVIIWGILVLCLLLVVAMRPERTKHSAFELKRRGDNVAMRREHLLGDIYALRRAVAVLFVMILTVLAWTIWMEGAIALITVTLVVVALLSRWKVISRQAMKTYAKNEQGLLRFVESVPFFGWLLGGSRVAEHDQRLESEEQLVHMVESAGNVLSNEQQRLIKRSLHWPSMTVDDVMTRVEDIVTVGKSELLGPLVLNDLHKSGHQRFPVISKDVDHILGQVNITELLEIDAGKKSQTAETVMTPIHVRLHAETDLPQALQKMLAHPGQLGLVVDSNGKSAGLVTIRDILKALLG
jgi:CBS domain containing-hemolysin-like protein